MTAKCFTENLPKFSTGGAINEEVYGGVEHKHEAPDHLGFWKMLPASIDKSVEDVNHGGDLTHEEYTNDTKQHSRHGYLMLLWAW